MMKTVVVPAVTLIVLLVVSPARADPQDVQNDLRQLGDHFDTMWSLEDGAWDIGGSAADGNNNARCKAMVTQAEKHGGKDTDKVPLLEDGPDFVKGDISLADAKLVCDRMQRMLAIKWWERWAKFSMQEFRKPGGGQIQFFENCFSTYDDMLRKGISADATVVPKKVNDAAGVAVEWSGTVKDLRAKYCDAGYKKAKEEQQKRDAPYKREARDRAPVPRCLSGGRRRHRRADEAGCRQRLVHRHRAAAAVCGRDAAARHPSLRVRRKQARPVDGHLDLRHPAREQLQVGTLEAA